MKMYACLKKFYLLCCCLFVLLYLSCKTSSHVNQHISYAKLQTIVYKTKADYSPYVSVTLNADKTEIVAYPAPKDVFYNGKLAVPTALKKGYWLDNRGVTPNSVFIKITMEDYAKLQTPPTLKEMSNLIIDKEPFIEIYNLGNRDRFNDEVKEINKIISKGELKKYTKE